MENIGSGPRTIIALEAYSATKKWGSTAHIWLLSEIEEPQGRLQGLSDLSSVGVDIFCQQLLNKLPWSFRT